MSAWAAELAEKIERREAKVGIVGLGYVGVPLALGVIDAGFTVVGIDVATDRVEQLRSGRTYLVDVPNEVLAAALDTKRLSVSSDYQVVSELDVIVIAVPTPLTGQAPDLSNVLAAADSIAPHLRSGSFVSLESTTYPGTTEEVLRPRLESGGLIAGEDFALAFSPERIDPGNPRFGFQEIPKIVGGLTTGCGEIAEAFYSAVVGKVITVARPRAAEMAKLLENTYRQVNIALANEFAMVANELDIDIWEVIEAAATKPFGFQPFYPGPGIGGHCIAVDPVYLTWRIRELGRPPFRLVELAREVDDSMPDYVSKRIEQTLEEQVREIQDAKILLLGVTYKPDVNDVRESRAIEVMKLLLERGVDVSFHDPYVEKIEIDGKHLDRSDLNAELERSQLVVILTHHSSYDWNDVVSRSKWVFDARGVTRGSGATNITRL